MDASTRVAGKNVQADVFAEFQGQILPVFSAAYTHSIMESELLFSCLGVSPGDVL
jgi:hypothetical protein